MQKLKNVEPFLSANLFEGSTVHSCSVPLRICKCELYAVEVQCLTIIGIHQNSQLNWHVFRSRSCKCELFAALENGLTIIPIILPDYSVWPPSKRENTWWDAQVCL